MLRPLSIVPQLPSVSFGRYNARKSPWLKAFQTLLELCRDEPPAAILREFVRMTLTEVNALSGDEFVRTFGAVFEDSPWVAKRAWAGRPFLSVEQIHAAMCREVTRANLDEQLRLLRAHPDLGTRARLSNSSKEEQSTAGLDLLTEHEYNELVALNSAYRDKFGF